MRILVDIAQWDDQRVMTARRPFYVRTSNYSLSRTNAIFFTVAMAIMLVLGVVTLLTRPSLALPSLASLASLACWVRRARRPLHGFDGSQEHLQSRRIRPRDPQIRSPNYGEIHVCGVADDLELPRLSRTCRAVSSSAIARASGSERASRSSFGDHQGVALPAAGDRFAQSGPFPVGAGQPVIDVHAGRCDAQRSQCVALGGEVLLVG